MFTGPVGPVEIIFYWPEAVFENFYWPWAIGLLLASSPGVVNLLTEWAILTHSCLELLGKLSVGHF